MKSESESGFLKDLDLPEYSDFNKLEFWDGVLAIILSFTLILSALTTGIIILIDTGDINNLNPIPFLQQITQGDFFSDLKAENLQFFVDREP
jgi:hypothetical protein